MKKKEMKKNIALSKALVLGIIVIFLGISILPSISGNIGLISEVKVKDSISSTTTDTAAVPDESFKSVKPVEITSSTPEGGQNDEEESEITENLQIRFKDVSFDPLKEDPDISPALKLTESNNYYLIQCTGPIKPEWIGELQRLGVEILGYMPEYAYVVRMEAEIRHQVEELSFVRWVGDFHPGYKIDSNLEDNADSLYILRDIELNIAVFEESDLEEIKNEIEAIGGEILYDGTDNSILQVKTVASKIETIAHFPGVSRVEESKIKVCCMDNIRNYTGVNNAHYDYGFSGSGIIGGVYDDGVELDHPDFEGQILATRGNPPDASHGTCTFGTIFSSGANNAQAKGILPNAKGLLCHYYLTRTQSLNFMNDYGAVFQCSGYCANDYAGHYTVYSQENDLMAWLFDDITQVWPAGNSGDAGPESISSDGAAKNVITVGGMLHKDTATMEDDDWGPYPGPGMGLPSYGPAADGRIKPDLCGPYDYAFVTDSGDYDTCMGYRGGDYVTKISDGKYGGTSAATAVVAGIVGIVCQAYQNNHFGNNPSGNTQHAATVKALLINTAYQYGFSKANRYQQGWGTPDLQKMLDIGDDQGYFIVDEYTALQTGESIEYSITPKQGAPLKITLVWTDPQAMAGANPALVNNLNLKVTAPNGTVFKGNYGLASSPWSSRGGSADDLNNVENVFIRNHTRFGEGPWIVNVTGVNIPMDGHPGTPDIVDQDFALVATTLEPPACGDANGDGVMTVGDVVFLINYLYKSGLAPDPICIGDVTGDGIVNVGDVVHLINYLYKSGDPPSPYCCR